MASEEEIGLVLGRLADLLACRLCGTRVRFADVECPHCGADLEPDLRAWASDLLQALSEERERQRRGIGPPTSSRRPPSAGGDHPRPVPPRRVDR